MRLAKCAGVDSQFLKGGIHMRNMAITIASIALLLGISAEYLLSSSEKDSILQHWLRGTLPEFALGLVALGG